MTHCRQKELIGYLRFNLSHCLQFELSQVLLAHHRAAQSDRNLISAEGILSSASTARHPRIYVRGPALSGGASTTVPGICSLS